MPALDVASPPRPGRCRSSSRSSALLDWMADRSHCSFALVTNDFLDRRLTERRNPATGTIDVASAQEIVDLINAEDGGVAVAVGRARVEIARAVDRIEKAFRAGGR